MRTAMLLRTIHRLCEKVVEKGVKNCSQAYKISFTTTLLHY